jgi:hypothetical protein
MVYEDILITNFPKKDASCRIGEEAYILCFLDEMLLADYFSSGKFLQVF